MRQRASRDSEWIAAKPSLCDAETMAGRSSQPHRMQFAQLLEALHDDDQPGFVLAELNDLLSTLTAGELCSAVEHADLAGLTPYLRNYVAAMVELAAHQRNVPPPAWVLDVEPMETEPRFATPLAGLRLHLLRASPVPFKRRNIFIDSTIGDRV
ncbi:MAG TPA: hypothetical protein VGG20_26135 [Thermoanaerobaculia bacterium]